MEAPWYFIKEKENLIGSMLYPVLFTNVHCIFCTLNPTNCSGQAKATCSPTYFEYDAVRFSRFKDEAE